MTVVIIAKLLLPSERERERERERDLNLISGTFFGCEIFDSNILSKILAKICI